MYKYRIPLSTDSLIDYEFLKRLHKTEINDMYGRIPYWGEEIVSEKFQQFTNDELIKICDNYEVLQYLKIPHLKNILGEHNLKTTGKKQDLIDRIVENIIKSEITPPDGYEVYIIRTQKGEEVFNKLQMLKEKEFADLIDRMVEQIQEYNFQEAYFLMCSYEKKQPFQRGFFVSIGEEKRKLNKYGVDITYWSNRLKFGLSENEIENYINQLKASNDFEMGALNVCLDMLSLSYDKQGLEIENYFKRHSSENTTIDKMAHTNKMTRASYYEKEGKIDEAIGLYEEIICDDFNGNHPYDRLAVIYHKRKEYQEEKRVLEHAIWVFENKVVKTRSDRERKLTRFKDRLEGLEKYL
nr:MAG TPA: SAP domain [Caudoviricetes sp.]